MDKYEYKVRAEEIYSLIREGEYSEAVEIADTIDWSRVKSIKTLCTISDLYKANRRYQESKEILLMAYERYPSGRLIVYSLCELSIKLEEFVQAIEYYKEYVQLAPKDPSRYILQYRLYEAQDVSLEERIEVLEEYKRKEYRPKWAYELAYLYHRMGLASKCVEECEELVVMFGEGKYVVKALELKALHEPLTSTEQEKYDKYMRDHGRSTEEKSAEPEAAAPVSESVSDISASTDSNDLKGAPTTEMPQDIDIQVKPVDVGQYNTMNLQEALAESMKELMDTDSIDDLIPSTPEEDVEDNTIFGTGPMAGPKYVQDPQSYDVNNWDKTGELDQPEPPVQEHPAPQVESADIPLTTPSPEVRTGFATGLMNGDTKRIPTDAVVDYLETQKIMQEMQVSSASLQASEAQTELIPGAVTGQLDTVGTVSALYDQMLAEEYSGQIRLAISEAEQVEKQITGQLSIDDVLADWETTKKENEKKREAEVRQRIIQHTGSLFDEFDEDTKASLIEQLEKAFREAIIKESKGDDIDEALGKKIRKEAMRAVDEIAKAADAGTLTGEASGIATEAAADAASVAEEAVTDAVSVADEAATATTVAAEKVAEAATEAVEEVKEASLEPEASEPETEPETDTTAETTEHEKEVEPEAEAKPEEATEEADTSAPDGMTDSIEVKEIHKALKEDEEEAKKAGKKPVEATEKEEAKEEKESEEETENEGDRVFSPEEQELFGAYLTRKSTSRQISHALDNMSMAAYTGNVIVTGEEGVGTLDLAKKLIKYMQSTDSNFVNRQVAKVSGKGLNDKDLPALFDQINGGAIIIESARGMKKSTVMKLIKILESETLGVLTVLEDTSDGMDKIVGTLPKLGELFNVRIDLKALDDKALVNYACEYAISQEHTIDEFALLALHTRIAEMQTSTHQVSVSEVRDLVDDAIYYADKKNPAHLFDIILHKRYDEEDMIILREKDFMHY